MTSCRPLLLDRFIIT
ncbi:hypothetical protein A2U01_0107163, partial [Trifolium medium]|nr:hypothetical protein [Trifolium medium]MCI85884.1 hypothetical protein [Trifolium medium]